MVHLRRTRKVVAPNALTGKAGTIALAIQHAAHPGVDPVGAYQQIVAPLAAAAEAHLHGIVNLTEGVNALASGQSDPQLPGGGTEDVVQSQAGDADVGRELFTRQPLAGKAGQLVAAQGVH